MAFQATRFAWPAFSGERVSQGMPVVELERLLLLREFQHLLHEAQPERQWNLKALRWQPLRALWIGVPFGLFRKKGVLGEKYHTGEFLGTASTHPFANG